MGFPHQGGLNNFKPGIYYPAIQCELSFDLQVPDLRDMMPHGNLVALIQKLIDHCL
jgi:hypothetical protein